MQHCGSAAGCFTSANLPASLELHPETRAFLKSPDLAAAERDLAWMERAGARLVTIHNPMARGCHRLLREGAKLVESAGDILEELAPLLGLQAPNMSTAGNADASAETPPEDPEYKLLLNSLDFAPTSVDSLVERTGLTPEVVSSMLLMLELQGHVEASSGGRYSRVHKRS